MTKKILLLVLAFTILSCKKDKKTTTTTTTNPQVQEAAAVQYGTPYASVPDREDAVIYQVNMRVFSQGGNFAGVKARLDSIKALGANIIYLMPIYPVGILNTVNSPYCVRDYKAVNTEFGTLADLRDLVSSAHEKGMSVILDWVANHTSWDNGWMDIHKDWYLQDVNGNVLSPPNMGWTDVAQLNYANKDMRLEMISTMKYWVLTANIDGFRCDYADGPPVDFWTQAIDTLRNIKTHKLLMMAEGTRSSNYSAGFDFNFGFSFFGQLKTIYSSNGSALLIDNLNVSEYNGTLPGQQMVRYLTNHDVNSSDGTALDLFGGAKGSMSAFVVVACMKSVPMIYNGQEVGTPYRLTFPFTTTKVNWTLNPSMTSEYKKILSIRNTSAAIRRGTMTSYSSKDVCAFTKVLNGETVLILSNLRNTTINFTLPSVAANASWKNQISNSSETLGTQISLEAYGYRIYKL